MHGNQAAALLLFIFIAGIVVGIFVIVSWASNREDSMKSLRGNPPDTACGGARRINGISRRDALSDGDALSGKETLSDDAAFQHAGPRLARERQLDR